MNTIFVYPGSFSPPTYGHLDIVRQTAVIAPNLIIVCSVNEDKSSLFTPEEAKNLWSSYELPYPYSYTNIKIMTLAEFIAAGIDPAKIIMVRGIRDSQDFDYEKQVAFQNRNSFGLNKFLYIMSGPEFESVSSTAARRAAAEMRLADLRKLVSARVATAILEKTLNVRNLVLVAGRPGSGKSTFLRHLAAFDIRNIHINTDEFNRELAPLLRQVFQEKDPIKVALEKEKELKAAIAKPWMEMLAKALRASPPESNVFVENPYAFKPGMDLYKLLGGKTLYFDCGEGAENERRLKERGTPHLNPFIAAIPDWLETERLAEEERLEIFRMDTSGSLTQLKKKAGQLAEKLAQPNSFSILNKERTERKRQRNSLRRRPQFSMKDRQHIRNALD